MKPPTLIYAENIISGNQRGLATSFTSGCSFLLRGEPYQRLISVK